MVNLYIDMTSGVAGDMLVGGLLHLSADLEATKKYLLEKLAKLDLKEPITLKEELVKVNGITSLKIKFSTPEDDWFKEKNQDQNGEHHHHHRHRHFSHIKKLIENSQLSTWVKEKTITAFTLLGKAEGKVHNQSLEKIHFHEVGSLDAILEIVSFYVLLEKHQIKKVFSSEIIVGSGYVDCQHGKMPVPVPAVVEMLAMKKAPFKKILENTGELTTPTGLALVLSSTTSFEFPKGQLIEKTGYGAGHKVIKNLTNVVRLLYLKERTSTDNPLDHDEVVEIKTTIDDMTGEEMGLMLEKLLALGALDVTYKSVLMKKGRIGYELNILSTTTASETLEVYLLKNSSALGFRYQTLKRKKLVRKIKILKIKNPQDPQGRKIEVIVKESYWGSNLLKKKIEFDSLKKITEATSLSIKEVYALVEKIYNKN